MKTKIECIRQAKGYSIINNTLVIKGEMPKDTTHVFVTTKPVTKKGKKLNIGDTMTEVSWCLPDTKLDIAKELAGMGITDITDLLAGW